MRATTTKNNATISFWRMANHTENGDASSIVSFLDEVKEGRWQDAVLKIRTIKDKEAKKEAKKKMPNVTLSGYFNNRTDKGLVKHSGYIGIDLDDIDPEKVKELLKNDRYVYAVFTSIGGYGACVMFKINGEKHRETFAALSQYFFEKYKLVCDPTSVNPSRARFVSYDPNLYWNEKAEKFTEFVKKPVEKKAVEIVYVQSDFDDMVRQIVAKKIDLTPDYHAWLRVGFALADKLGEQGRAYFHALSQFNNSYEKVLCDKQYDKCLGAGKSGVTLASLYYYAKQAGIQIVSDRTQLITKAAYYAKKGGRTKETVIKLLQDAEMIPESESAPIIDQVFNQNIQPQADESFMEQVQNWLKSEYELRRNEITRKVEVNGKELDDIIFNDIYCMAKIMFESINPDMLQRIINSNLVPTYNPFFEFFNKHADLPTAPNIIKDFFACIESDMGLTDDLFFPQYVEYFGTKWLVGIISSIHGKHSPLMLVLTGAQGNGKTEFFRQLLPAELQSFFAESKMDNEKDDVILMTRKLLLHDDEMSGRSKKEEKRMKELTSKQTITVREPYGRYSSDLNRIAVFCGSTNNEEILNDPTGNRRIIPVHVIKINFAAINAIDRTNLFMAAYRLYKSGFEWEIKGEDIKILEQNTGQFQQPSLELELLTKFFKIPADKDSFEKIDFLTPTEVKDFIEMRTAQKLGLNKIGSELRKMGSVKKPLKRNGQTVYGYNLIEKPVTVDAGRYSVDIKKAA